MSRASLILVVLLLLVVAGLVWLSRGTAEVQPHRIEKVVTLNGADGAQ